MTRLLDTDPIALTFRDHPAIKLLPDVEAALDRFLMPEAPTSAVSNWASRLGSPCDRERVLWRTQGEKARVFPRVVVAMLREGNVQQEMFVKWLTDQGFAVFRDRRRGRWAELQIGAATDFWLAKTPDSRPILAEFKAPSSPWVWAKIEAANKKPTIGERTLALFDDIYLRKWLDQTFTYEIVESEEVAWLIVKRPGHYEFLIFIVALDYVRGEILLRNAERTNSHLAAGTLPDFYRDDPAYCRRCPFFGTACFPPVETPDASALAIELGADPEFMGKVARRDEIRPISKEYEALDEEIKDRVRDALKKLAETTGKGTIFLPEYVVSGAFRKRTWLEVPAERKPEFTKTDPHGAFVIDVKKVTAPDE